MRKVCKVIKYSQYCREFKSLQYKASFMPFLIRLLMNYCFNLMIKNGENQFFSIIFEKINLKIKKYEHYFSRLNFI